MHIEVGVYNKSTKHRIFMVWPITHFFRFILRFNLYYNRENSVMSG